MGQPSFQASNAVIYLTYGSFLYVLIDSRVAFLSVLTFNFMCNWTVDLSAFALPGIGDTSQSQSF